MRWRRIAGAPFGVELLDDVRDAAPGELAALLAEHQLLVAAADLTEDEHIAVVSTFGRVLPQGPRVLVDDRSPPPDAPTVTYVSNQLAVGGLGDFELLFHSDMAHTPTPYAGLSLFAVDVAPGQAPTRFASGALAFDRLSGSRQALLSQLQGLFIGNYTTIGEQSVSARLARELVQPNWPHAVHPLVVEHPLTRRRCVFVNEMQTVAVLALERDASDELLDELFALLYDSVTVYEHEWQSGQLVVWDNLALQHARPGIVPSTPRVLRRVVFGERAPWEAWPSQPAG